MPRLAPACKGAAAARLKSNTVPGIDRVVLPPRQELHSRRIGHHLHTPLARSLRYWITICVRNWQSLQFFPYLFFGYGLVRIEGGQANLNGWHASFDCLAVSVRARIQAKILRFETGNLRDHKSVGDGIGEARVMFGPWYRIYFGKEGRSIVLLLLGGDKPSQADLKFARGFLLAAMEEGIPLQQAVGKAIRAMGIKEFGAMIGIDSPNLLRAINPRHNPTQATIKCLLALELHMGSPDGAPAFPTVNGFLCLRRIVSAALEGAVASGELRRLSIDAARFRCAGTPGRGAPTR
jgi:putative addiction module killer protein